MVISAPGAHRRHGQCGDHQRAQRRSRSVAVAGTSPVVWFWPLILCDNRGRTDILGDNQGKTYILSDNQGITRG